MPRKLEKREDIAVLTKEQQEIYARIAREEKLQWKVIQEAL